MNGSFQPRRPDRSEKPEKPIPEEATILIFGASGDLTGRKLVPALYRLCHDGYLAASVRIIGVARREKTDQSFRDELRDEVAEHSDAFQDDAWERFAQRLHYHQLDLIDTDRFPELLRRIEGLEERAGVEQRKRIVYLAVAPDLFLPSIEALHTAGMIPEADSPVDLRVVIEKPFGRDLESARELSAGIGRRLREEQVYRIDHYLGKETVQNVLLFRFGNAIFEPLLNRNHVDHVQITVAETQGMESGRGGYYDKSGALRDVLQNHVLQLLCLTAMEPPALFRAEDIRDEKLKVLEALTPGDPADVDRWAIAGQYSAAEGPGLPDDRDADAGGVVAGYRQEERVPPDSNRETYVAMQVGIDNWRWAGVPFYLRTGKRMPRRFSEIAIQFKLPPKNLFTTVECDGNLCELVDAQPNTLIFRIQPKESITLAISTKRPGMQYQIHPVKMDFEYNGTFAQRMPEAYERLLLDVLRGDTTLFTRTDELEAAWAFVTPVLEHWEGGGEQPHLYPAASWGPDASEELLRRSGRHWRRPGEFGA